MLRNLLMFSSIRSQRLSLVILQSIGCLGSLGFLSAGMVAAQDAVPGAAELLQSAPAPAPAPEPPAAAPAPEPVVEAAPAPVVVEVAPTAPVPSPAAEAPAPAAPVATEADPAEQAADSTPTAAPEVFPNRGDLPISSGDVFIDPTDYSVGATTRTGPDTVVFAERSTGCQRAIANGQAIPSSICQAPARPAAIAQSPASSASGGYRTATYSRQGGSGLGVVGSVTGQTTAAAREYYNRGARVLNRLRKGELEFVFPLTLPAPITSAFGWRIHPISGGQRFHAGTDIGAPLGTPVVAAQAGRIAISNAMQGYGLTVVMDHFDVENGVNPDELDSSKVQAQGQTLYAHLSQLLVEPGEWVEQGEVIGLVGSTGNSTGPHLHFELKQFTADGWVLVDPGQILEYTLAQLVETLRLAEANAQAETQARNGAS